MSITEETVTRLIAASTATLKSEIKTLQTALEVLTNNTLVTEYELQKIDENISCNEPLDVIKSLPEFSGNAISYVSWREAANNSLSLYAKGSRKYFAALTILRNKIINSANDILTNHGTVLNYDAIIWRLDFVFADKRPAHIIEQELRALRQGNTTLIDYYNIVNQKLTLLINKTIMTHGTESEITKELNRANRRNALRIFTTGLNPPLSNILFSLSPEDLPSALAKAQELESNNVRAHFALQFNRSQSSHFQATNNILHNTNSHNNNLRFPTRNQNHNRYQKPEQMELGSSAHRPITKYEQKVFDNNKRTYNPFNRQDNIRNNSQSPQNNFQRNNNNYQPQWHKPNYNTYNNPPRPIFKRERNNSIQQSIQTPPVKMERINNLNEQKDNFLGQTSDYHTYCEPSMTNK